MKSIHSLITFAVFALICFDSAFAGIKWEPFTDGAFPPHAIPAGAIQLEPIFACRGWNKAELALGHLRPSLGSCVVEYENREVRLTSYDVASGMGVWISGNPGLISDQFMASGITTQRTNTYTCRAISGPNKLIAGKFDPRTNDCTVCSDNVVEKFPVFEILVEPMANECIRC